MITLQTNRIAMGAVIIAAGCGAVLFIAHESPHPVSSGLRPPASLEFTGPPVVHAASWYVAHPEILKQDEQRCAGDAATISRAACQNVASADARVAAGDYGRAAAQDNAANVKTPKAP